MQATRLATENHLRGRLPSCVTPVLAYRGYPRQATTPATNPKEGPAPQPADTHPFSPDDSTPVREYQPVHPFDYACRPRLRTRLTQGRRTLPWNPWSSSGGDCHPALATHVCILTPTRSTIGLRHGFTPCRTLSYPVQKYCRVFGGVLEPRYIVGAGPLDQ